MRNFVYWFFGLSLFSYSFYGLGGRNVIKSENDPNFNIIKSRAISKEYREGEYLIYDCENQHYVCVNRDSNKECENKHLKRIRENQSRFSCIPLKIFADEKTCFEFQQDLIDYKDPLSPLDLCKNYQRITETF